MNIKRLGCGLSALALAVSLLPVGLGGNASAIDLSSKIQARNLFGGDVASFKTSYDAATDVTTLETTLYLNDTAIDGILSQKSGKGSSLGSGYIELKPNLEASEGALWYKQNYFFKAGTDIAAEKADIKDRLKADVAKGETEAVSYDTVWPVGAYILYKNSEGKFVMVSGEGDGKTSVRDALVNALGLTSADELVYGENYKIGMYTAYEWLNGWLASDNTDAEPYWILNTYKITYPIAGVVNDASENYYKDLASALAGEETKVIVREDTSLDGDLVVPEGKTLEVAKDTTIALAKGAKVSGAVTGEGKVTVGGIDYTQLVTSITLGTGAEELELNTNETLYLRVFTAPEDAAAEFEVTNSDAGVVSAALECKTDESEGGDENLGECYNILTLNGMKDGEATITVTDKNTSKSASVKITVAQKMEWASAGNEEASIYVEFGKALKGDYSLEFDAVKLTDELKAQSEYLKAVFDINVIDNETGKAVSVKDNEIETTLMLDADDYEGMKYFKIVYINDEGKIAEEFDPEVLVDEELGVIELNFTTTHFSTYGVLASATEIPSALTPETGAFTATAKSASAMGAIVTSVLVGLAVSLFAAKKLVVKRK